MGHLFLSPLERWLIRRLIRSPRIGFVLVKEYGSGQVWALKDTTDPVEALFGDSVKFDNSGFENEAKSQDVVSVLDKLYKAPDAKR